MKTVLLSTAVVLALCGAANATDFYCSKPQQLLGRPSVDPQDTVDRIDIRHSSNSRDWMVHNRFLNGTMIMRQEQYSMVDASNPNVWSWRGQLRKNGAITMIGELRRDSSGRPYYIETQFDRGRVAFQTRSDCMVITDIAAAPGPYRPLPNPPIANPAPPPAPPVATPAPPPVIVQAPPAPAPQPPVILVLPQPAPQPPVAAPEPLKAEPKVEPPPKPAIGKISSIPVNIQNNVVTLNVGLGSETVSMVLDTGATHSSVSRDIAERLVSRRQARWDGEARVKIADGSVKTEQVILIYEVRVGKHVVRNVSASVSSAGIMLLGFSILNEIGSFMIDNRNNELVFVTVEAKTGTTQNDAAPPPVATPSSPPVTEPSSAKDFWPEGTAISKECGREMNRYINPSTNKYPDDLLSKLSPECQENMKRWGAQLDKNLKNPAFKKHIEDIFTQ
jgi:clan AA aspartic protease (TIGR02281 family)